MKFDHDLVRDIMLQIESADDLKSLSDEKLEEIGREHDAGREQVGYTLMKMHEGGLINGQPMGSDNNWYMLAAGNLTFIGHEYLDNIRDKKVWRLVKNATSGIGSASLKITSELAALKVKEFLGLQ
jgi:hypothetical protein